MAGDKLISAGRDAVLPPAQLRPDPVNFRGRQAELARLHQLMEEGGSLPPRATNLLVVTGVAGCGKSALAIHWAHQVAERFSDGNLYLDLQGFTPDKPPLGSLTALLHLLRSMGVPEDEIPDGQQQCEAKYRSEAARRRLLIVLDNAQGVAQLLPLLPANRECVVLVTSRQTIAGVPGVMSPNVELKTLTEKDAVAVIAATVGAERTEAEPEATLELIRRCGHLPLALTITSAKIATSPQPSIAEFVAEFGQGEDHWSALTSDDVPHLAVRTAFEPSYRALPAADRILFSRLGLLPGRDFTLHTAAAVGAHTLTQARNALRRLTSAHLVESAGGRYQLHDLLRLFAAEQVGQGNERDTAEVNVYRWYLAAVDCAVALIDPDMVRLPHPVTDLITELPDIQTREDAQSWLEQELENLVEAVETAAANGHLTLAYWISDALRAYFWLRRTIPEWLRAATAGLDASRRAGDGQAEAALMHSMGIVEWHRGNYATCMNHLERAVQRSDEAGWSEGVIAASNTLATVCLSIGRFRGAVAHYERAILLSRQTHRTTLEAGLVNNQGRAFVLLGATGTAMRCFTTALHLSKSTGNPPNAVAEIRGNLGYALLLGGRLAEAVAELTRALELCREAGTRGTEASIRDLLAMTYLQLGEFDEAAIEASQAQIINVDKGSPDSRADNLLVTARISVALGHFDDAIRSGREALDLYRTSRERRGEVEASNLLGQAQHGRGRTLEARALHSGALHIASDIGFSYGRVEALCGLADTCLDDGDQGSLLAAREALGVAERSEFQVLAGRCRTLLAEYNLVHRNYGEVTPHCRAALDLHRRSGCRPGLVRTLRVLGSALFEGGRVEAAVRHWQNATRILDRPEIPEQQRLITLLNRHADGTGPGEPLK